MIAAAVVPSLLSCSSQKKMTEESENPAPSVLLEGGARLNGSKPVQAIPHATAFKMNGDYARNVAITLKPDGSLAYYPAPSDITTQSSPINLGNGWWLNRQGISANSVFTTYTFEDYALLKKAPSRKELLKAVIPGSAVTEIEELPFTLEEATEQLDSIRRYLSIPHRKPSILRPKK